MQPRQMSPWEAFEWFDLPTVTIFSGAAALVQVAQANVRRVVLAFSWNSGGTIGVAPTNSVVVGTGLSLLNTSPTQILTHEQHGSLVQVDWWSVLAMGATLTVIELFLRDWPRGK